MVKILFICHGSIFLKPNGQIFNAEYYKLSLSFHRKAPFLLFYYNRYIGICHHSI